MQIKSLFASKVNAHSASNYRTLSPLRLDTTSPLWLVITDLKFRWTATQRTVTLAAAGWGGTTLTWREKQTLSFSRGDGRRRFFSLY